MLPVIDGLIQNNLPLSLVAQLKIKRVSRSNKNKKKGDVLTRGHRLPKIKEIPD